MEWERILQRARKRSLKLEALLRSCKPLTDSALVCPHRFHREELAKQEEALEQIFGHEVELFESGEDYDPLVKFAVEELGAVVS